MTGKDAIVTALHSSQHIMTTYLSDMSDADLLVRPVPGANTIAWQIGHLISSEQGLLKNIVPNAATPELPAGFAQQHSPESAKLDSTKGFLTKAEYLSLLEKTRAATLAAIAGLSDADLDKPTPGPMGKFAPTFGAFLLLISNHTLMHAGQYSVVRRKLGKPILM